MSDNHDLGPLLNRVRVGDRPALEALLAKIRPYLHLLVRQQLEPGMRNKLGDSDIVQETLLRINGGLNPASPSPGGRFQGRTPPEFLAWVSQIVHHIIVDLERRRMTKTRDEKREVSGSKLFVTLTQGSTPEEAAERAEKALQLAAALERLPQRKQDVLRLRFFEQLSFEEIGQQMDTDVGTLRVLCWRALNDLREDKHILGLMEGSS